MQFFLIDKQTKKKTNKFYLSSLPFLLLFLLKIEKKKHKSKIVSFNSKKKKFLLFLLKKIHFNFVNLYYLASKYQY